MKKFDQAQGEESMQKLSDKRLAAVSSGTSDAPSKATARESDELVVATVPQGYATTINLRLVRGVDFERVIEARGCQPRKGAQRRDAELVDLPAEVVEKLKEADQAVVAWLAEDEANVKRFLSQPALALAEAGVKLTRADQKAIARSHREVKEATVVAPGVKVAEINAAAFPRGKVGKVGNGSRTPNRPNRKVGCTEEE
jgi:hypothetical protein